MIQTEKTRNPRRRREITVLLPKRKVVDAEVLLIPQNEDLEHRHEDVVLEPLKEGGHQKDEDRLKEEDQDLIHLTSGNDHVHLVVDHEKDVVRENEVEIGGPEVEIGGQEVGIRGQEVRAEDQRVEKKVEKNRKVKPQRKRGLNLNLQKGYLLKLNYVYS